VKQTSRLAAFAEQYLLRILVRFAPQDAAEGEQAIAVRRCATPLDGIRDGEG